MFQRVSAPLMIVLAFGACEPSPTQSRGEGEVSPVSESARYSAHEAGWMEVTGDADWADRAGLQAVRIGDAFYVMGGRTPRPPAGPVVLPGDSDLWSDVGRSRDRGETWTQVNDGSGADHWPARAYFQAVTRRGQMYVLGGQDFELIPNPTPGCIPPGCPPFISTSQFFNDVWVSRDGEEWRLVTDAAEWGPRAGLTSVVLRDEIYVFGGSFNDDPAVIGGPPLRVYFNDVWKSRDGHTWELLTDHAPWAPRAGAAAVVKDGYIYLLGGEEGFICQPVGFCTPPYFNDVWRTRDGVSWELVTASAEWSPRPGHQAEVIGDRIYLFGGFGHSQDPTDPFAAANPMDVWSSTDGRDWRLVSGAPWQAADPGEIKYDFAAVSAFGSIFTFGGDRETFDFFDLTNYLRIDSDVWRFRPDPGVSARPR
jgi:hypothetical protein